MQTARIDEATGEISRSNGAMPHEQTAIQMGDFCVSRTGLTVTGTPTYEAWTAIGETLRFLEGAIQWALGDWLNYGEHCWGEKYAQAVEETDYSINTLQNYAWVAGSVDSSRRREELGFSHHTEVASLRHSDGTPDEELQQFYIELAIEQELTVSRLRQRIKDDQQVKRLEAQLRDIPEELPYIVLGDSTAIEWAQDADLVIADPPYGLTVGDDSGVRDGKGDWDDKSYDELHRFNTLWLDKAIHALKPTGSLMVFGSLHNIFSVGHLLREYGLYIVRDIIWYKPFIQKQLNKQQLAPAHEIILWARKGDTHTSNIDRITRDVWEIHPAAPFHHPAEKPEELISRLIAMATNEHDLVIDPFLGSGVSAAVCRKLSRRFWGVEQDEYWHGIATKRARG